MVLYSRGGECSHNKALKSPRGLLPSCSAQVRLSAISSTADTVRHSSRADGAILQQPPSVHCATAITAVASLRYRLTVTPWPGIHPASSTQALPCAVAMFAVVSLALDASWRMLYASMQQLHSCILYGVVEQDSIESSTKVKSAQLLFLLSTSVYLKTICGAQAGKACVHGGRGAPVRLLLPGGCSLGACASGPTLLAHCPQIPGEHSVSGAPCLVAPCPECNKRYGCLSCAISTCSVLGKVLLRSQLGHTGHILATTQLTL